MTQSDTPGWQWIPAQLVHLMQLHRDVIPRDSGLFVIQALASVYHHVLRFLGDATIDYSLLATRPRDAYVRFSGDRKARIRLPLLKSDQDCIVSVTLPQPLL